MRRAVFLDRDGTIIRDEGYFITASTVTLEKGVVQGLRKITSLGYSLIVVTNQSGIARGYFTESDMHDVNDRIRALLAENGISIDGWYFCPHGPQDGCNCRKPAPALLLAAAHENQIDLFQSIVVGDKLSDLEAGASVGARGILVKTGAGKKHAAKAFEAGYQVCSDLTAVSLFMAHESPQY